MKLIEELLDLAAPLQKWLQVNYDLMCEIRIQTDRVDVLRLECGGATEDLANRVAELKANMELLGISQRDLARRTGLSNTTISRLLDGSVEPLYSTVQKCFWAIEAERAVKKWTK